MAVSVLVMKYKSRTNLFVGYLANIMFVYWGYRISTGLSEYSWRFMLTIAVTWIMAIAPFIKYWKFTIAAFCVAFFFIASVSTEEERLNYDWVRLVIGCYGCLFFL